jgi:phosphohistidine phosphatase
MHWNGLTMKRLILLRHAKSSWNHPEMRDFERPLNERGNQEAVKMGTRLKERGMMPDRIVSSPAARAAQTAEIVAVGLDYPKDKIQWMDAIYDATAGELLRCIQDLNDADAKVLFIGHNPGITAAARHLTGQDIGDLPTCGALAIDFDLASWSEIALNQGHFIFFEHP